MKDELKIVKEINNDKYMFLSGFSFQKSEKNNYTNISYLLLPKSELFSVSSISLSKQNGKLEVYSKGGIFSIIGTLTNLFGLYTIIIFIIKQIRRGRRVKNDSQ